MQDENEEVAFEAEEGTEQVENKIAKMRKELSSCCTQKKEYMDGWQRAKADYVNALKRFGEEKKVAHQHGVVQAAQALLPAFDALERAKEHGDIPEGFVGIVKQLENGFSSLNLESFGEINEAFNPALHEALGQDSAESIEIDDTISEILEKGWKINEQIIRPAKVRVFHFTE